MNSPQTDLNLCDYKEIHGDKGLDLEAFQSYVPELTKLSKTCTLCEKQLSLDCFYRKGDRFDSRCKQCINLSKKRCRKKLKRHSDIVSSFTVVFKGRPDPRLLADKLKPIIFELRSCE